MTNIIKMKNKKYYLNKNKIMDVLNNKPSFFETMPQFKTIDYDNSNLFANKIRNQTNKKQPIKLTHSIISSFSSSKTVYPKRNRKINIHAFNTVNTATNLGTKKMKMFEPNLTGPLNPFDSIKKELYKKNMKK